ncbi:hypothetical protein KSK37_08105 [Kaistella sp. DKR-2]|uniref:hypothetical protein n=1 Tax=Kaistella soli TaxID=2849654 RepID=UPI001C257677|nr:hypothetical protein [Kaistella soli]MBU8883041.1 hypothetical protein [Kaistella soli]
MKIRKIIGVFILFCIISCTKTEKFDLPENQEEVITMNSLSGDYDSITKRVKKFGDEDAYSELFYSFKDSNFVERTDSLMIYSKIMAEEFRNENAYIDYLDAITEKFGVEKDIGNYSTINLKNLKPSDKKQVLDWLKLMVQRKIITQNQYDSIKK